MGVMTSGEKWDAITEALRNLRRKTAQETGQRRQKGGAGRPQHRGDKDAIEEGTGTKLGLNRD